MQCIGIEFGHCLRHAQQAGIAHFENLAYGHGVVFKAFE
jgi:hypothetical protein